MAVLNKIRQRSLLLIFVIGFCLLAFLIGDLFNSGNFQSMSSDVGSVNGEDISFEDFRIKVDNTEKSGQQGQGMTTTQAVNRVWDQEVNVKLLSQELDKIGLRVGEKHLIEVLKNNPNFGQNPQFQNDLKEFDINKLRQFIKENPTIAQNIEAEEKNAEINARYNVYSTLLKAGYFTTLADAKFKYELENNKVSFDFVQIPFSSIKDSEVKVTDAEIIEYMKKNEKKYKAEESREVEFVIIEDKPSEADKNAIKESIESLLNEKITYNNQTGVNDTLPGFRTTKNPIEFVNQNSDFPYDSTYVSKTDLPAEHAEQLFALADGAFYGPYIFGDYYAVSKSMGRKAGAKVKASHILISYEGIDRVQKKEKRTKEEAQAKAQSLLTQALANPDSFAMLAMINSDDSSAQQGGDLGFFGPNQMVKPFNDFVFGNTVGKIGLVESEFGFHIIKVTDKQDAIRLATLAQKIEASEKTSEEAYTKAVKLEMAASQKSFENAIKESKLVAAPVAKVKAMDENVGELGAQRQIVRWAFDGKTELNAVKRFDIAKKGYAIARLKKINEKGLTPVEDAKLTVEPILKNKKKAEKIMAKLKGNSLQTMASSNKVAVLNAVDITIENPVLPNAGFEPKVVGVAFSTKPNTISKPIEGNTAVYVVVTKAVTKAVPTKDYSTQTNALKNQGSSAPARVFQVLKDKADITDNRAKFNY